MKLKMQLTSYLIVIRYIKPKVGHESKPKEIERAVTNRRRSLDLILDLASGGYYLTIKFILVLLPKLQEVMSIVLQLMILGTTYSPPPTPPQVCQYSKLYKHFGTTIDATHTLLSSYFNETVWINKNKKIKIGQFSPPNSPLNTQDTIQLEAALQALREQLDILAVGISVLKQYPIRNTELEVFKLFLLFKVQCSTLEKKLNLKEESCLNLRTKLSEAQTKIIDLIMRRVGPENMFICHHTMDINPFSNPNGFRVYIFSKKKIKKLGLTLWDLI